MAFLKSEYNNKVDSSSIFTSEIPGFVKIRLRMIWLNN